MDNIGSGRPALPFRFFDWPPGFDPGDFRTIVLTHAGRIFPITDSALIQAGFNESSP
jgi:hypothetical protein